MNITELHKLFLSSSGVSTDTRKIKEGNIFFALEGENFNANEFAAEAVEKGAQYAVVDEDVASGEAFIRVKDSLESLQELAAYHRRSLDLPIIGLTGSNGKTTSKELINAVLSKKFKTVATVGNLNNHIGVPLTLLSMNGETEIGIVEMGANHQKEIQLLSNIAQPDYGYITNFGKAHLEGFGSPEGVVKGKKELYDHLKEHGKTLFLNMDDPLQKVEAAYEHSFSFGEGEEVDVRVRYHIRDAFAGIEAEDQKIFGKLIGSYNGRNMAAAYCIGRYFHVSAEDIRQALENYTPQNNRSQIIERNGNQIILDAYNANPTSMAAAVENFSAMNKSPKVAFLGDMFELGPTSNEEHQQLVSRLRESGIEKIYLLGENFHRTEAGEGMRKFRSFEDFRNNFNPAEVQNSLVLIKGSRGMALERILELI